MLAARSKAINDLRAIDEKKGGAGAADDYTYLSRLTAYCSAEAHSCVEKTAKIG